MKADVETLVVITDDSGVRSYYVEDTDLRLTVPTLAELDGVKKTTAHDEEWTVDVYELGDRLYAVRYFNEPKNKDVHLLTFIGAM